MTTWIALLRGVNVSGKNRIAMAELRDSLEASGFEAVRTYIQSGNVVFQSTGDAHSLAGRVAGAIRDRFGHEVEVTVLTPARLAEIVRDTPYEAATSDEQNQLYFTFLFGEPEPDSTRLDASAYAPDEVVVRGDVAYVRVTAGYGKTKLSNSYLEQRLRVPATTRNWRTAQKLLELGGVGG